MTIERKSHKYAKAIKAWADGKPIQFRISKLGDWEDYRPEQLNSRMSSALFFPFDVPRFDQFEWRVKPENIIVERSIWLSDDEKVIKVSVGGMPNVRFAFDFDTQKLVKAEVIR